MAMGDPDRIDDDGRGGSVLIYESAPDYDSPDYDILNPDASARKRQYAYFYLDEEGDCYRVDTNRSLPATPGTLSSAGDWSIIFDWLVVFPLLLVFETITANEGLFINITSTAIIGSFFIFIQPAHSLFRG